MLYTYPDYYEKFSCVADACEDTCCAGWQIVVDDDALRRYIKEETPYKKKLFHRINWQEKTFCQDEEKRCAFLTEHNLCDMYLNLGKDSLCKTCRTYPRHIEEFEDVREVSLSVSCPEVAKMLIARKDKVTFYSVEKEGMEEDEAFDPFLYSMLVDARECMFEIVQNRELSIATRILLCLGLAHDVEVRVNRSSIFECSEVIEKYKNQKWLLAAKNKAKRSSEDKKRRYAFSMKMFRNIRKFELLKEDWDDLLTEAEILLFAREESEYAKLQMEFYDWIRQHDKESEEADEYDWSWNIFSEQFLVYFLYTYFCGSIYDGEIFANVQMAVASLSILWDLLAVRWLKNDKMLDAEDVKEVLYRFSRELEHSDINKNCFLNQMVKQKKWFK